ncbi:uncharacterized protein [Miscanthus floridulus]|uniref:uncharacterized protein n=1 Tax=Miscanthus floridulus TaxID=154761 RepID=UPI003458A5E2
MPPAALTLAHTTHPSHTRRTARRHPLPPPRPTAPRRRVDAVEKAAAAPNSVAAPPRLGTCAPAAPQDAAQCLCSAAPPIPANSLAGALCRPARRVQPPRSPRCSAASPPATSPAPPRPREPLERHRSPRLPFRKVFATAPCPALPPGSTLPSCRPTTSSCRVFARGGAAEI